MTRVMTGINNYTSAVLVLAALALADSAAAANRVMAVYTDGRVVSLSAAQSGPGGVAPLDGFSCDDADLAFVFTETVNNQAPIVEISVDEASEQSAQATVSVVINQACGGGEATFDYRHESAGASIGSDGDVSVMPGQFSISVPVNQGGTAATTVTYAAVDDNQTEQAEALTLFGDQIIFFVDENFGQVSQRRDLARITVPANTDDAIDTDELGEDVTQQELDAIGVLNDVCRQAGDGNGLAATCGQIQGASGDQARQVAQAVDAQNAALAAASAIETGRIQHDNLTNRLAAIRGGSSGISVSNLQLVMNDRSLQAGWVQALLQAEEQQQGQGYDSTQLLGDKWGLFVDGSIALGDRDPRSREPGFDFDSYGLTAGIDYRFDNGSVLGAALGYSRFDASVDRDGGGLETDAVSLQVFGSIDFSDNFYVDATAGYSMSDVDQVRVIDLTGIGTLGREIARADTDIEQFSGSLAANHRALLGAGWSANTYASVYYADISIDAFAETGSTLALSFEDQDLNSLLTSVGLRVSKPVSLRSGVLTPFADLSYEHEFEYDPFAIDTRFVAAPVDGPGVFVAAPDRDFGTLAAGASWVFPSGNQLFVRADTYVFNGQTTRVSVQAGARFEF